jgi:hypothetical protein
VSALRARAYYRMSDDRQENSIERQQAQVQTFAEKNGYSIVHEYTKLGISGSEIAKRKDFQRMPLARSAAVSRSSCGLVRQRGLQPATFYSCG